MGPSTSAQRDSSAADSWARRHLPFAHFVADAAVWAMAIPLTVWLRYDFSWSRVTSFIIVAIIAAMVLQAEFGLFFGQYRRRWRYGSFDEIRGVAGAAVGTGAVLTVLLWWEASLPRSVPLLATGICLLGQVAVRSTWRLYSEKRLRPTGSDVARLLIVGAGDGAVQVIQILRASRSNYDLIGLLDDDKAKQNLEISGIRVVGTVGQLGQMADRLHAQAVLIAVPSADSAFIRAVTHDAETLGLDVLVLPPADKLFGGVQVSDIRPVAPSDLLGRRPADIDNGLVADYINGRRVLVTGAGGSIGSEICRQLAKFEPAELLMLDRDESGLHTTQLSISGRALLEDRAVILGDIRDAARVDEIFAGYRPEVVFHTAALKHLPLLELYPDEGWKTNVCGTLNLLHAAGRHGVDRFVNVSTDKAANPTSVLGWTKRITERLTSHANVLYDTQFVSVRFGNVLGSSGSVFKAFEAQAENGGPLTVTHPDITRYFMTIEEASRLTIHAGAIGEPGEVMILDMGEPVRIIEVAQRFATRHDPPLEVVFTGLRSNEKLHEDLVADGEVGVIKSHPLISHVQVAPLIPTPAMSAGVPPTVAEMIAIACSAVPGAMTAREDVR